MTKHYSKRQRERVARRSRREALQALWSMKWHFLVLVLVLTLYIAAGTVESANIRELGAL